MTAQLRARIERGKTKIEQDAADHRERLEAIEAALPEVQPMLDELEAANIDLLLDDSYGSIDIRFAGNKAKLETVWGILRRGGFEPNSRMGSDKVSRFSTYWYRDGDDERHPRIWFSYTSTVCRLVKTGVKMRAEDEYEVVCDEESA